MLNKHRFNQNNNNFVINGPLTQVGQISHPQSFRQSNQKQDKLIKQRGFSLQYLKITKNQRIKSFLQLRRQKNPFKIRMKTQNNQISYKSQTSQDLLSSKNNNNKKLFFNIKSQYKNNDGRQVSMSDQKSYINQRSQKSLDNKSQISLLNKQSFIKPNKNYIFNSYELNNKRLFKQKFKSQQKNSIKDQQNYLIERNKNFINFNQNQPIDRVKQIAFQTQYYKQLLNKPLGFVHLTSAKLKASDLYFTPKIQTSPRKQQNSSFHRKSKYSPFKSKIISSVGKYEQIITLQQQQNDNQTNPNEPNQFQRKGIKTVTKFNKKQNTKLKFLKHKRISTLNPIMSNLPSSLKTSDNDKTKDQNQQNDLGSSPNNKNHTKQIIFDHDLIENQLTIHIITSGLINHIKLLKQFKKCFQLEQNSQSPKKQTNKKIQKISQLIKIYVLGPNTDKQKQNKNIAQDNKNSQKKVNQSKEQNINTQKNKQFDDSFFSKIDNIFNSSQQKHTIKQIVCFQKLLIILLVDLMVNNRIKNLFDEIRITLKVFLNIYINLLKSTCSTIQNLNQIKDKMFQKIFGSNNNDQISQYKTHYSMKKSLKKLIQPYIQNLYRYSKNLFQQSFKIQIQQSKTKTINRTFYEILKKFAIYLTNIQQSSLKNTHYQIIANFVTCPAPYILNKPSKRYTLCVDLDQTLLYSKFSCSKKFQTFYRPGAHQFIIQLSKYFEIIVFTSAIKQYADQVIKPFCQFVDHMLYRHHTTRGINFSNTSKDITRVGRKIQKIIFIDDLQCNIKPNPQNSIQVTPWKGQINDKQLFFLRNELQKLGKQQQQRVDVRQIVKQIKLKKQKESKKSL